jgi:hypothetical protein
MEVDSSANLWPILKFSQAALRGNSFSSDLVELRNYILLMYNMQDDITRKTEN